MFGPNNFPFAFNSIAGGDFVAAIAAGNPVIGKANTGHPGTSKLLAELAFDAAAAAGPAAGDDAARLPHAARRRAPAGVAPRSRGDRIHRQQGRRPPAEEAADKAGKPIYLEMSSTNPVFLLPGALAERLPAIAGELFDSCALGAGQFCTRPGITVVVESEMAEAFLAEAAGRFDEGDPGYLARPRGTTADRRRHLRACRARRRIIAGGREIDGPRYAFANTLLRASGDAFLSHPHALQTEAFGTVNLVVIARDAEQMIEIAASLEGNLTGSVYSDTAGSDDALCAARAPCCGRRSAASSTTRCRPVWPCRRP